MESFLGSVKVQQSEGEKKELIDNIDEPVSPTGLYLNSSVLCLSILAVLEFQTPLSDFLLANSIHMLRDIFLPISPRFSSIVVSDKNGINNWKKVEVKLDDHLIIPVYPSGLDTKSYDEILRNYLSKLAMEQLPQTRPLWELHMFKYPTSNAASTMIFKFNHALGDGYSLMGALLSCLQKSDSNNSTIPLTFPQYRKLSNNPDKDGKKFFGFFKNVPSVFSSVFNTVSDFTSSILKSSMIEDDWSPLRSGKVGVEVSPMTISTLSFSLDQIKQIKNKLGVTLNDVISGVIFLGIRLYIQQAMDNDVSNNLRSTTLLCFNTREITGYKSLEEMKKPSNGSIPLWGNQFCFLHIPIPELSTGVEDLDPVDFIMKTHEIVERKRSSLTIYLNACFLQVLRKLRGHEVTSKYVHSTMKNATLLISNMVGPMEQMSLADNVVKGIYFMPVGSPQSLVISILSYMGELRVALMTETDHIDSQKFKSCIENAFNMMLKATMFIGV